MQIFSKIKQQQFFFSSSNFPNVKKKKYLNSFKFYFFFRCYFLWWVITIFFFFFQKKVPAELFDEGGGVAGDVARKVNGVNALEDDVVRLHGIQSSEGRRSRQQFKHENAQRPVVGANVVPFIQNHFRGNVFGSAAKRPRFPSGLSSSKLKVTNTIQIFFFLKKKKN